jgi:hypothetical protein
MTIGRLNMHEVGKIIRLQIQIDSLKSGERPYQSYSPANIRSVVTLRLTPQGVVGVLADGTTLLDAHHENHQVGKNRGDNGISLNFTSHYGRIQERFGERLVMGCAGENILVATAEAFSLDQLDNGVHIQTASGESVSLHQISAAAPCEPFSRYCLAMGERPLAAMMKATLQFLDNGTRGFYATLAGKTADIQVGDRVFIGHR